VCESPKNIPGPRCGFTFVSRGWRRRRRRLKAKRACLANISKTKCKLTRRPFGVYTTPRSRAEVEELPRAREKRATARRNNIHALFYRSSFALAFSLSLSLSLFLLRDVLGLCPPFGLRLAEAASECSGHESQLESGISFTSCPSRIILAQTDWRRSSSLLEGQLEKLKSMKTHHLRAPFPSPLPLSLSLSLSL